MASRICAEAGWWRPVLERDWMGAWPVRCRAYFLCRPFTGAAGIKNDRRLSINSFKVRQARRGDSLVAGVLIGLPCRAPRAAGAGDAARGAGGLAALPCRRTLPEKMMTGHRNS